ncbi:MAG: protein kinase [Tannerella sp.]|jgi:serine/threonine protein kinase|nr:protein kinase [Tannerella sp.]
MSQSFLNEYEILSSSTSHEGAFATVYKVRHKQLGYIRAIRVLRETIVDEHDEKYRKFLAECQLLLRLGNGGHPNIVRIAQPRLLQGHALVEMEYVYGKDLNDYIIEKNHFIPIDEVLRLVLEISSALAYCHEGIYEFCMDREQDDLQDDPEDGSKVLLDAPTKQRLIDKYKVIHNDIHSKNIIRKYDGSFILLDFGLSIQNGTVVKSSTRKGGVAEYKAPEKWENEGLISEQTDIYSFGILMYEMLTGRVPFLYNENISSTKAEYELMQQHENATPPPIEPLRRAAFEKANSDINYEKDYPDWLEALIMKCLEKQPENRYQNAQQLFDVVEENHAYSNKITTDIIKGLEAENNQFVQEIALLQQNDAANRDTIENLEAENNQFVQEIAKLQQNDAANRETIKKLGNDNYLSVQRITLLRYDVGDNKKAIKNLEEKNKQFVQEITQLQKQNSVNRDTIKNLEAGNNRFIQIIAQLKQNNIEADNKIKQMESKSQDLQEQLDYEKARRNVIGYKYLGAGKFEYNGFIKFWLLLMILWSIATLYVISPIVPNGWNYLHPDNHILSLVLAVVLPLFNIVASVLLWRKSKIGLYLFVLSGIIAAIFSYYLYNKQVTEMETWHTMLEVVCITAVFFILRIKKDGVSGWYALNQAK